MLSLKKKYQTEVVSKLKEEYKIKNTLALPRLLKVVVNVGVGDAKDDRALLDSVVKDVTALAGQRPVITKARGSISGFKLGKGQSIGVSVTLRGNRMYQFLEKLIGVVLPKVRDFRGVSPKSFDNQGNYTLGLPEQTIFPEVVFSGTSSKKSRGLEISIVTTAKDKEQGKRFLELMGMPFMKGVS